MGISQTRAVMSSLPVTRIKRPGSCGRGARPGIERHGADWPRWRSGRPIVYPVNASQRRAAPSPQPVATNRPSGLNVDGQHAGRVQERLTDRPTAGRLPEAGGPVVAGRHDHLAVGGAERDRIDTPLMRQGHSRGPVRGRIPEPGRHVCAAGQDGPPVGAVSDGVDLISMYQRLGLFPARRHVPELSVAPPVARQQRPPVRAEGDAPHPAVERQGKAG